MIKNGVAAVIGRPKTATIKDGPLAGCSITIEHRFWSKVDKTSSPHGCWLWTGGKSVGYGSLGVAGGGSGHIHTHRFSWLIHRGAIPARKWVLHVCERFYLPGDTTSRRCVNPDHLYLGTTTENNDYMVSLSRHTLEERHPMHKLTRDQVREILADYKPRVVTLEHLAHRYGVSVSTVEFIVKGKIWKSVFNEFHEQH